MKRDFFITFTLLLVAFIALVFYSLVLHDYISDQIMKHEEIHEVEESMNSNNEDQDPDVSESQSEPDSYQFVGVVDGYGSQDTEVISREHEIAENDEEEGVIPEMTIFADEVNIQSVARYYNYVPVFITEDRILGRYINGRVEEMDSNTLSGYASRGRQVHPTEDMRTIMQKMSDHYNKDVNIIYLVPNQVEEYFVITQMDAIKARNLRPSDVAVVYARYRSDFSVEVTDVVLK